MTAAAKLRRLLPARDKAARRLAELDRKARAAIVSFSRERGYLVPLRIEQIPAELERMA